MTLAIPWFFRQTFPNIHHPDYLHVSRHRLLYPKLRAAEGEPIEAERSWAVMPVNHSRAGCFHKCPWLRSPLIPSLQHYWLAARLIIRVRSLKNQLGDHRRARKCRNNRQHQRSTTTDRKVEAELAHKQRKEIEAKSMEKGEIKGMVDVKLRVQN